MTDKTDSSILRSWWSAWSWSLNGDHGVRHIDRRLSSVGPIRSCEKIGIGLSEQIENAKPRHVIGDDVLKVKNKDKETRQSWVLRYKTTFQKVKSKDTAFQTLKQEKIW